MTFLIWLVLAVPLGFAVGVVGMGLWLALKPLALVGLRVTWKWVRATVTSGT